MTKSKLFITAFYIISSLFSYSQFSVIPRVTSQNHKEMELQKLNISVQIIGNRASTSMDLTFFNPNDRTLEGEFNFPLSQGMQVTGFALDLNGSMRDAVVVPKQNARIAFEDVTRKKIDPAIVEKTAGNNYKTRIFPLPAKGTRRIIITFDQLLSQNQNNLAYFLPIKGDYLLKEFSLNTKISASSAPSASQNSDNFELNFNSWDNIWESSLSKQNFTLDKNIAINIPQKSDSQVFSFLKDGKNYFFTNIPNTLAPQKAPTPKNILIYWDNSSSAASDNLSKKTDLLKSYLSSLQNVNIDFITFNIEKSNTQSFNIKNGVASSLISFIENLTYDGATDLSLLNFSKNYDSYLLFSDGISNFSKTSFSPLSLSQNAKAPIYTIVSNPVANHNALLAISNFSNGNFIDLNLLSPFNALNKLQYLSPRILDIKVISGSLSEFYPKKGSLVSENISLAGITSSQEAVVQITYGYSSQNSVSQSFKISKGSSSPMASKLIDRIFGTSHINWEIEKGASDALIDSLGLKYNIVTSGTSLIVLEDIADYVKYNITPPADLLKEFEQYKLAENPKNGKEQQADFLKRVIEESDKQTSWWKTSFPLKEKPKSKYPIGAPVRHDAVLARQYSSNDIASHSDVVIAESVALTAASMAANYSAAPQNEPNNSQPQITISLGSWDPDTPYLKVLQYADKNNLENTYFKLKKEYGHLPSFYVDSADFFFKNSNTKFALQILSNLAELNLEDQQILKILAYKLSEFNLIPTSINILEKIALLRPEEPQSFRDLALAYAQNSDYQQAIETLYKVVTNPSFDRFFGIQLISMNEINNIIASHKNLKTSFINPKLLKKEPVDLRVIIDWDTNNSDMDLWVTDPRDEKCFYANSQTYIGGKISKDFTQGYGPEEFMIKKALKGEYKIQVNYFANHSQKVLFPVTLRVKFFTNYGSKNQQVKEKVIRLSPSDGQNIIDAGSFSY